MSEGGLSASPLVIDALTGPFSVAKLCSERCRPLDHTPVPTPWRGAVANTAAAPCPAAARFLLQLSGATAAPLRRLFFAC